MKTIHVAGVILVSHDSVLLARRKTDQAFGGLLEIPGGKIEPGESIIHAAKREMLEELGTRIPLCIPFMSLTWKGPEIQVSLSSVLAPIDQKPTKSIDHSELLWITLANLPIYIKYNYGEITKPDIPILEVLAKQYQVNPDYFRFFG